MLNRLPITLAQLKAGNNSQKHKTKLGNYCILCTDKKTYKTTVQRLSRHYLKMETIFMNTENRKTNEHYRFRLSLADKLDLKNPNKNITFGNLSIYYTWKNIKSAYK